MAKRARERRNEASESEDSEDMRDAYLKEQIDDAAAYNQLALRRYELQKLKYYFAIVHCNSAQTALWLYDEYNGLMLENTNVKLRMAIVPDEQEFDQKLKDSATSVP